MFLVASHRVPACPASALLDAAQGVVSMKRVVRRTPVAKTMRKNDEREARASGADLQQSSEGGVVQPEEELLISRAAAVERHEDVHHQRPDATSPTMIVSSKVPVFVGSSVAARWPMMMARCA